MPLLMCVSMSEVAHMNKSLCVFMICMISIALSAGALEYTQSSLVVYHLVLMCVSVRPCTFSHSVYATHVFENWHVHATGLLLWHCLHAFKNASAYYHVSACRLLCRTRLPAHLAEFSAAFPLVLRRAQEHILHRSHCLCPSSWQTCIVDFLVCWRLGRE
jgi:hypothetical protein